ncbi:MAG: UPF0182 family protein [Nitrospirae bacterium]|nr:UPF0182 family protein [Nitrospirota bacterium]
MIRFWSLIILVLFGLLLSGNLVSLYTDWLWFQEVGQLPVYMITLGAEFKTGLAFGLLFFVVFYLNLSWAHRYRDAGRWDRTQQWLDLPFRTQLDPQITKLIPALSAVVAFLAGLNGASQWEKFLRMMNASGFGLSDPVFGNDFGFYVFKLPFINFVQGGLMGMLILISLFTAFLYVYHGGLGVGPKGFFIDAGPKRHLTGLIGLILAVKAAGYRLSAYELLFTTRGVVTGAVYADLHARIPALNLLAVLSLLAATAVIAGGYRRGWRLPLTAVAALAAVHILGGSVYPDFLHRFRVLPNEIVFERPYIQENIKATRYAYGLNNIEEQEFPAEENLTIQDLAKNDLTLKNVRLWDHRPLLSTYRQLQQIRTYYDFVGVDNDRYEIDGEYRQVMLSPRELSSRNLPGGANWINEHLTYTHGYGVAMGPVNRISKEGLPEFMIKDIPPVSTVNLKITRPEIYYGELTNSDVFVKTKSLEFDYPLGDKNEYSVYNGKGGVPVGSLFRKLMLSVQFASIKILLSNDITAESRVLYYRNIIDRVRRLAPFLDYDQDPYLVITKEGRLVWIVDGYTTTDRIPYSHQLKDVGNYIRNSVKGVIDAYDGTVTLYINDPDDPIIRTYDTIFPGLLKPLDRMPADLRSHLRYPEDLFRVQAHLYAKYHMQDPQIFYNQEDLWNIPSKGDQNMEPYYTIMKLPKETKEEFILMVPYTPAKRDNMAAWMAARADAPHYGKLIVYLFPKQKLIYGPRQIEARIDQDGYISQQITLWSQRGSKVIRGSLLVIPIENSLLYIEPLYLSAEAGSLPELRRVVVAYGNQLSMQDNLEGALAAIFGGHPLTVSKPEAAGAAPAAGGSRDRIHSALSHFERAQELLRQGDWAGYGKELKETETILRELAREGK